MKYFNVIIIEKIKYILRVYIHIRQTYPQVFYFFYMN